jgi:hypothetical protein
MRGTTNMTQTYMEGLLETMLKQVDETDLHDMVRVAAAMEFMTDEPHLIIHHDGYFIVVPYVEPDVWLDHDDDRLVVWVPDSLRN